MITVPFTRFILPHGRQEPDSIELGDEVAAKLKEILESGCRLTAEVLMNGICSFCVEEPEFGDFDQELCVNGPQVPVVITKMILRFDKANFDNWMQEQQEPEHDQEFYDSQDRYNPN